MALYFWRMSHDPLGRYWQEYGWTVFYDSTMMLSIIALCFIFAFTTAEQRSTFDMYFLTIFGLYELILNIAVVAQKYDLIEHTYGLYITSIAIAATTIMISICSYRYGYLQN